LVEPNTIWDYEQTDFLCVYFYLLKPFLNKLADERSNALSSWNFKTLYLEFGLGIYDSNPLAYL